MEPQTLRQIVESLEPRLQQTLSAIAVELHGETATATLSIALYTQSARQVDIDAVPDDVSVGGFERWPKVTRPLSLTPDIQAQINDLQASGLVGMLDASRFDHGANHPGDVPRYRWIIKTHAGTERERSEWLKGLRAV